MDTLARKLERSSRVKENIAFFSAKTNSLQYCESRLESKAVIFRDLSNCIRDFATQPTSIFYEFGGKILRYTPDALVRETSGDMYFEEIKPFEKTKSDEFIEHFRFLQNHFETELKVPLRLNIVKTEVPNFKYGNYEILHNYYKASRRKNFDHIYTEVSQSLGAQIVLDELISKCNQLQCSKDVAFEMIARGFYSFSPIEVLKGNSELELQDV